MLCVREQIRSSFSPVVVVVVDGRRTKNELNVEFLRFLQIFDTCARYRVLYPGDLFTL